MLKSKGRTKADLIRELSVLRLKIADLERFKMQYEQAARDLSEKKKEYRTIFDSVPVRVMYLNVEGRIIRVNKTVAEALRMKTIELIGKSLFDIFPVERASKLISEHMDIMASGEARLGIMESFVTAKGKTVWFRVDKIPYRDRHRKVIGIIIFAMDVTGMKKMEDILQETEERFRHFMEHVPIYVFFKDDKIRSLQLSRNYEQMLGRPIRELIGKTMDDLFPSDLAKSMIEDDKRVLREGKPIEVEEEFNGRFYTTTKFPLVRDGKPPLLAGFTMDITDRKTSEAAMHETVKKLRMFLRGLVQVVSLMVKEKAPFTSGHQKRVSDLARTMATMLRLAPEQIEGIRVAGSLHDLGMIGIPGEILSAPRRLTDYELGLIKSHPVVGFNILKDIEFPWPVANIIIQHHERLNGSSYPYGLRGEEITLDARIIAVADIVEAVASHRPYRPALGIEKALEIVTNGAGTLYDPAVVDTCVSLFREKGYQLVEE